LVYALGSDWPKCSTFPALIRSVTVRHVFDSHGEIDAVLIVEIDAIGLEALQRFLDDAPDALRTRFSRSPRSRANTRSSKEAST
jgi:hypothetical protein